MPQFTFSQALTANQLGFNPLAGWQYEYLPWPASIILLVRATDVNERLTIYSGSETIQERSPVQGGGTAGTTPTEFTTAPVSWLAAAGDRLKLVIDNTTAGTPVVDGVIIAIRSNGSLQRNPGRPFQSCFAENAWHERPRIGPSTRDRDPSRHRISVWRRIALLGIVGEI